MLFGDSITQGGWEPGLNAFGQRLSHVYARRLDVLNRGYSGYNSEWCLPVFEQCIAKNEDKHVPKIRVLTIWLGANDSCIKPSPQHVDRERFASNLREMVTMIKSPQSPRYSPTTRIILVTPPPVDTATRRADLESRDPPVPLDRLFDVTESYAEAVREVAASEGVAVVDIWSAVWEAAGKEERGLGQYLADGLHLNGRGYEILYDALMATIAEEYPDVHYDNIPFVFPQWKDINWDEPRASLVLTPSK